MLLIPKIMKTENNISLEADAMRGVALKEQESKKSSELVQNSILIVEDDEVSFLYLATVLKKENYPFIRATRGEDAVKLLQGDHTIFLVLMDIKMPGLNGIETTKVIRKFNKTIPIIAQTAYALSGDKEMALQAGCNDYIPKPIKKEKLFEILEKYL